MAGPRWLAKAEVIAAHERQLAEHGGPPGLRDEGLLESALARPMNLQAYGDPDVADLAAAYAYGLVRNHAFVDGNKRASFPACTTFLRGAGAEPRQRADPDREGCRGAPGRSPGSPARGRPRKP